MENASNLVVPLWGAVSVGAAIVVGLGGLISWAFSTFAKQHDHEYLEMRVKSTEDTLASVGRDVSFIRGFLEKGGRRGEKLNG